MLEQKLISKGYKVSASKSKDGIYQDGALKLGQ